MDLPENVTTWTTSDVSLWLKKNGFEKFSELICNEHEINGRALLTLTEKDLRSPPLQLKKLGDIKNLSICLEELHRKQSNSRPNISVSNGLLAPPPSTRRRRQHRNGSAKLVQSQYSDESCMSDLSDVEHVDGTLRRGRVYNPEYKKTLVSFLYSLVAAFATSYTMVLAHDRVPDKTKHPPLPDIFLDNIPLIPYAFKLTEYCGLSLMFIWICILLFHKHRFILLRRMYSIISSVFLLRCVTMFVTSLSVPGDHLQCHSARYVTTAARLKRALEIFCGGGMTITGLKTCGDYMFSGHTIVLTLLNHLITEYTPPRWYYLHIVTWVFNLFGIFFILAAHEHYSIDVVIAFYITSRVFLYYHMLANTRSYYHSRRIRVWFPMFSYFECNVPGKVPNEYEWPFSMDYIKNCFKRPTKSQERSKTD